MNKRYKAGDAVVFRQGLYIMPWNETTFKESHGPDTKLISKWPDSPNVYVQSWSGKNYIAAGSNGIVVGRKNVFLYDRNRVYENTLLKMNEEQRKELFTFEMTESWSKKKIILQYVNVRNNHIHVVVNGQVIALPYGSRYIEHLDKSLSRCNSVTVTFTCKFSAKDMTKDEIESWIKKQRRALTTRCREVIESDRVITKKENAT